MDLNNNREVKNFDFAEFSYLEFYKKNKKVIAKYGCGFVIFLIFFHIIFFSPPQDFPLGRIITIEKGSSLGEISKVLDDSGVVKYGNWFKVIALISFKQKTLASGDYVFNKKLNIFFVLRRISKADYGLDPASITFPEGITVSQIAKVLKMKFENFKDKEFISLAKDKEGFLFPDTYTFLPNVSPREVISVMEDNFNNKTESLTPLIKESKKTLLEIITMASLLEEEARTKESREMISDILWSRIKIGMALQVDATFPYIIGKNTYELTLEDLEFDSPYNTYKYSGLPPGPISNPGLVSIEAALNPKKNDFLFYLSDKSGVMHYARDFETHKLNKARYLR